MIGTKEQWDNFYLLIGNLSKEVLTKIAAHVAATKYVSTYFSYPQSISKESFGGWTTVNELSPYAGFSFGERSYEFSDFSSLCSIQRVDDKICVLDLDGYAACAQFLSENTKLLSLIWYSETTDDIGIALCLLIGNIINRYIALTGQYNYEEQLFKDIYISVTNAYFSETLEFDICVPVLFVGFGNDNISINDNIFITKMTDDFIKSKHFVGNYDAHFEKLVLDCATHMIVIKGYSLQNDEFKSEEVFGNWRAYPIDIIDLVFASIRAATGMLTGYAQIIVRPTNNWIPRHCKGNLIGLTGAKAKEYPDSFLEYF